MTYSRTSTVYNINGCNLSLLLSKKGNFLIKVVARNLAGLGAGKVALVNLSGGTLYNPENFEPITDDAFRRHQVNLWEEMIFISDHGEIPKDWRSIRAAVLKTVCTVREQGRRVENIYLVTDTGGENWGTQALAQHSFGENDFNAKVIWCPTAAGHSGQPSDSCGGTFKRRIMNEAIAGNLRGVNTGNQLVMHARALEEFSEVDHKKFLSGLCVSRFYYYLSMKEVITDHKETLDARVVMPYDGVSKFKQAFGTGTAFQLMVRKKICCCVACLAQDFEDCELKDYVDLPKMIHLRPENKGLWRQLNGTPTITVNMPDPLTEIVVEKNSYYAVQDIACEFGFVIIHCLSVTADSISGTTLLPLSVEDGTQHIQLTVSL